MTPKQKHDLLLGGGITVGGVVVIFVILPKLHSTPTASSTHGTSPQQQQSNKTQMMANPQQGAVDAAFLQARSQALSMYDQTVLGEKTAQDQLIATNNETAAQKAIAFNQDATAYKTAGLMGPIEEQIAQTEANAQEVAARQAASAQVQTAQAGVQAVQAQQPSWWQSLLGALPGIGSIFGFNTGGGTATVPTDPSGMWNVPTESGGTTMYNPTPAATNFIDYLPQIQVPTEFQF